MIRNDEAATAGEQHADAVAVDVERGAQPQFVVVQAFAAVSVDDDILRGREKRHNQRGNRNPVEMVRRGLRQTQRGKRCCQPKLHCNQPAAPPPEAWQGIAIKQRRPQKFQRVGQADQREQADIGELDAAILEPRL